MKNIMFDSNIFNKLPSFIKKIKESKKEYSYYISTIQIQELAKIKDNKEEQRISNIIMLADLRAHLVPTSVSVLGEARLGYTRLGDGSVYHKILNDSKNNISDAIIADTAVKEGCILITEDIKFQKKMKRHQYDVMSFDEFISSLEK